MPNTKSAEKSLRQNIKRRTANRSASRAVRTECRQVVDQIAEGKIEEAAAQFRTAVKKLDQAASKRVIHRNAAARLKSRLSKKLKAAKKA